MDFLKLLPQSDQEKIIKAGKPCLRLSMNAVESLPLTASRLCGYGYLPKSMPYPRSKSDNSPLSLLAQINFAEMPHLEDFPEKGLAPAKSANTSRAGAKKAAMSGRGVALLLRGVYHARQGALCLPLPS